MEGLSWLQWPAMAVTICATMFTASLGKHKREIGFWMLLAGNVLWSVWGWHDRAYALIAMQVALAVLNIYGIINND